MPRQARSTYGSWFKVNGSRFKGDDGALFKADGRGLNDV
jgi:hypothetical protein